MKKFACTLLALIMILSLTACGSTENTPAKETNSAADTSANESTDTAIADMTYPVSTLNIVVPYSAGGDTDIYARLVADRLEDIFGITVIVNNMTGGKATVAGNYVLNSAPDGATVLFTHTANLIQMLNGTAQYNIIEDFDYAGTIIADRSNTLVVMADSNISTLEECIAALQANPSSLKLSPAVQPINFEIQDKLGVEFDRVDVGSNASERVVGLLNGQVDVLLSNYVSIADYVEAGQMIPLAIVSNTYTPDIPTFSEKGYDVTDAKYYEMRYPKGTDQAVIDMMAEALRQISEDPTFAESLNNFYSEVCYRTPQESYDADTELATYYSTLNGGILG